MRLTFIASVWDEGEEAVEGEEGDDDEEADGGDDGASDVDWPFDDELAEDATSASRLSTN